MTMKEFLIKVLGDFFRIFSVLFLILGAGELVKKGFATNYLNMNYYLLIVMLAGIIYVITNKSSRI